MFDRYTLRALQSVGAACLCVSQYGSAALNAEHLLLGVLQVDPDAVGRFLQSKTTDDIRAKVEQGIVVKPEIPPHIDIPLSNEGEEILHFAAPHIDVPLSAEGEQILTFAAQEGYRFGHRRFDIAHFVAGIVREQNGIAGQILRSAGVNLEAVRQHLSLGEAETE